MRKRDLVCVFIPVYKKKFNKEEEWAVEHNLARLNDIDVVIGAPKSLDTSYYTERFNIKKVQKYADKYFKSQKKHNRLLMDEKFYASFEYEYICICQPDVLIFGNTECLMKFCGLGIDYIGAPWFPAFRQCIPEFRHKTPNYILHIFFRQYDIQVGNGGLSLRNCKACEKLIHAHKIERLFWRENEDKFFALIGKYRSSDFKIADIDLAQQFSLELKSKEKIENQGIIPFGIHAYQKHYPDVKNNLDKYIELREGLNVSK